MKSIVLISSGQPSLNPRLIKEADALVEVGLRSLLCINVGMNGELHLIKIITHKKMEDLVF